MYKDIEYNVSGNQCGHFVLLYCLNICRFYLEVFLCIKTTRLSKLPNPFEWAIN